MQGLILAAGRGSRLGHYSPGTPKCLLEIARRPLIDHQLAALSDAGVAPVGVVTGYCADEIRHVVGIRAEYIHNPRWSTTNSVYSFWLARQWVKGPVVILNCDVLFAPAILERLLAAGGDALVYDSSTGAGREQMKVRVGQGGRVVELSKTLDDAAGENVGMLCFRAETARALFLTAERIIAAGGENAWLPAAVSALAAEAPIRAVDIAGTAWGEIDCAYDLDHVRRKTWPEIRANSGRRRRARALRWALPIVPALLGAAVVMHGGWPVVKAGASWETMRVEGARSVELSVDGQLQGWSLLGHQQLARVTVRGPGPVRVDSRALLERGSAGTPYVLRVELDGKHVELHKWDARPGPLPPHLSPPDDGFVVARRKRAIIELPPGQHILRVSLLPARDHDRALVRIRSLHSDVDEDREE